LHNAFGQCYLYDNLGMNLGLNENTHTFDLSFLFCGMVRE
jgi:hypothetical protein